MSNETMTFKLPNAIYYGEERDKDGNIIKPGEWTKEIEITEMKGKDEDLLVSRARKGDGKGTLKTSVPVRISKILSRVTTRIGTMRRPADKDREKAPDFFYKTWEGAFSSDRFAAMVRMRQHTLGDDYDFAETCPECHKNIPSVHIDLSTLDTNEKTIELASQEYHEATLPRSGDVVHFRFFTGKDEEFVNDIMSAAADGFRSRLMAARILSVNGEEDGSKLKYVENLGVYDRQYLAGMFDDLEGGLDSTIQITCDNPNCATEFSRKMQIMGRGSFFFPSVTRTPTSSTVVSSPTTGDGASTE